MTRKLAYLSIISAAFLWGIIGLFVSRLYALGFTPTQVVAVRMLCACLLLVGYASWQNRKLFRIRFVDLKYFVGTGIVSVVMLNLCLFTAIQETSISVATILLYTAPAFVTLFSRLLFKESLSLRKVMALLATLTGCALVVGFLPYGDETVTSWGLLLGLGAGFFYALYSIFGKYALQRHDPLTVTVYTFLLASLAITPFSQLGSALPLFREPETWLMILGLGFLSTMLAFLLYTRGLQKIESSRAAIIATLEPVVASLMSFWVFGETLNGWQYAGIGLVLAAVLLVQQPAPQQQGVATSSSTRRQ
jgi:drug/metabolite transporter (DMT)-like permease